MGFYFNNKYITDDYLKYRLISSNKASLEGGITITPNDNVLLNKLDIHIDNVTTEELVSSFMELINDKTIDKYSILSTLDRTHILAIFYLVHSKKVTPIELERILYSTSYKTRTELLLSMLEENEKDSEVAVDLFGPLKKAVRKMSNYTNSGELHDRKMSTSEISRRLSTATPPSGYQKLNYGSYFYRNINSGSANLFEYCDTWVPKTLHLPDTSYARRLFTYSGNDILPLIEEKKGVAVLSKIADWYYDNIIKKYLPNEDYNNYMENFKVFEGFNNWWAYNDIYKNWHNETLSISVDPIISDVYGNIAAEAAEYDFSKRLTRHTTSMSMNSSSINSKITGYIKKSYRHSFNNAIWLNSGNNQITTLYDTSTYNVYNYYSKLGHFINSNILLNPMESLHDGAVALRHYYLGRFFLNIDSVRYPLLSTLQGNSNTEVDNIGFTPEEDNQYYPYAKSSEERLFSLVKDLIVPTSGRLNNEYLVKSLLRHSEEVEEASEPITSDDPFTLFSSLFTITMKKFLQLFQRQTRIMFVDPTFVNNLKPILEMDMLLSNPKGGNLYAEILNFGTMPVAKMVTQITNNITTILESDFGTYINRELIIKRSDLLLQGAISILDSLVNTESESIYIISYEYARIIVRKYLEYLIDTENSKDLYYSFRVDLRNTDPRPATVTLEEDESNLVEYNEYLSKMVEYNFNAGRVNYESWLYKFYKLMFYLRHSILAIDSVSKEIKNNTAYNTLISNNVTNTNKALELIEEYIESNKDQYTAEKYNEICDGFGSNWFKTLFKIYSPVNYFNVISKVCLPDRYPTASGIENMKELTSISLGSDIVTSSNLLSISSEMVNSLFANILINSK